ncbi:hypothetical protein [Pseudomonas japonica]|uniref:CVNH domain-containing protein n=1 Tax=Pseudomonas japonica TaxID=256466 RepID=A0A239CR61_9PSED|nr:hypothetical protein [Pseudomonas japonica]SNS22665.1 hypothetical protein SAMN05444352_10510 [Pseudomonas japonica]
MTTASPIACVTKASALLVILTLPQLVHADDACDTAFAKSTASSSCDRAFTRQYEPGSCEISVECKKSIGYGMKASNVIHRKLDSVSQLTNEDGILRGGTEAKPPVVVTPTPASDEDCLGAWKASQAGKYCKSGTAKGVINGCIITASCYASGENRLVEKRGRYVFESVFELKLDRQGLSGGEHLPDPDPDPDHLGDYR